MSEQGRLGGIGLTEDQEALYRLLIEMPSASAGELSTAAGKSVRHVRRTLASLEEAGLASRIATEPDAYVAEPPATVLGNLLQERQREIESARAVANELIDVFRHHEHPSEEAVTVISGQHAVSQRYMQMLRDAQEEILIFDTPPYAPTSTTCQDIEIDGMSRGVRYRTVYESSALEVPGNFEVLDRLNQAGEQTRIAHDIPMKLAIQDRALGMIPFHRKHSQLERVLVIRESALLDALIRLFEEVWGDASPLRLDPGPKEGTEDGFPSEIQRRMLGLMCAGLKDGAVARQLGLSVRTVERHMADLMVRLNTKTRFECAVRAVEQGLIDVSND